MAFVIADRVRETTSTTGTGNLTLDGAVSKFRTFASVLSSSDTTYYSIVEQTGTAWEVGIGTFTSPSTLARTTILSSSNGGSAVNFGAGTKDVFITLPASKTNTNDQPNVISVNSTSDALRITQTGTGNALVVEDSANPDATPFVVDATGNVGIGTSSPGNKLDIVSAGSSQIRVKDGVNATAYYDFGRDGTDGFFGFSGAQTTFSGYKWSVNAGSEVMRITNGGNLGIGTSSGTGKIQVVLGASYAPGTGWSTSTAVFGGSTSTSGAFGIAYDDTNGAALASIIPGTAWKPIYTNCSDFIVKTAGTTEAMRVNSSGNVGIGTSSPNLSSSSTALTVNTGTAGNFAALELASGGTLNFYINANNAASYLDSRGSRPMVFYTNNTERARITSNGDFCVNATSAILGANNTSTGFGVEKASDGCSIFTSRNANVPGHFNRNNDGTLINFYESGTAEGSISVSGTTVSYNGGHLARWSQLPSGQRDPALLKGTVLSNLDEMCVWLDEQGNPLSNEQLNKMKISDVEGDPNVAGVFVSWDNDDQTYTDDMNVAMTGDMIIRIAQGVVVQKGDLLMSAGDGTAKPQGDDIRRSKTVAKVTSNHVTCTYADGSYCVPCVLMAC